MEGYTNKFRLKTAKFCVFAVRKLHGEKSHKMHSCFHLKLNSSNMKGDICTTERNMNDRIILKWIGEEKDDHINCFFLILRR